MRLHHALRAASMIGSPSWRYWRIYVTATNGSSYCGIQEIEITLYGGADLTDPNMSTDESSFHSSVSLFVKTIANRITDPNDAWVTATSTPPPHWGWVDLGAQAEANEFSILPQNYTDGHLRAPKDFIIQGSDNGIDWADIMTFAGVTSWARGVYKKFNLINGSVA